MTLTELELDTPSASACFLYDVYDLLHAIWIFLSETCYDLQKLVPFARCCTSRNFCHTIAATLKNWVEFHQRSLLMLCDVV